MNQNTSNDCNQLISIIIPTYNREKTIEKSIRSVLSQNYPNMEIIVVDDGSQDATKSIVEGIHDKRVKYIYQNHGGANKARNTGLSLAGGYYIAFNDSDDEWLPGKLEKQLAFMKEKQADVVCSLYRRIDGESEGIVPGIHQNQQIKYEDLLSYNLVDTATILGKKECFDAEKYDPDMPRFQDWELMLRICSKYSVWIMGEVLVNAYVSDNSITHSAENGVIALQKIMDKTKKNYIEKQNEFNQICNEQKEKNHQLMTSLQQKDTAIQDYEETLRLIYGSKAWRAVTKYRQAKERVLRCFVKNRRLRARQTHE